MTPTKEQLQEFLKWYRKRSMKPGETDDSVLTEYVKQQDAGWTKNWNISGDEYWIRTTWMGDTQVTYSAIKSPTGSLYRLDRMVHGADNKWHTIQNGPMTLFEAQQAARADEGKGL